MCILLCVIGNVPIISYNFQQTVHLVARSADFDTFKCEYFPPLLYLQKSATYFQPKTQPPLDNTRQQNFTFFFGTRGKISNPNSF